MTSNDGKIATSSPPIQEYTGSKKDLGVAMDSTAPIHSALRPQTLLDLVLTRLHNSPDSPAISFIDPSHPTSSTTLTTTQLFRLATRIQRNAHIASGCIVPICMARGPRPIFIASMLAVLCAGAAYVVLDAENGPSAEERNLKIAREVRADKILADIEGTVMMSDENETWEVVDVEGILATDWPGNEGEAVPRTIEVAPEDPAFIIYTSGSTGTPKGVIISHRAVVAGLAHPLKCLFAPGPAPRWLSFFAPPTAATQRMTWSMLVHGGCLCVASREAVTTRLGETLAQLQVQGLGITPSALMSLLDAERMPTDVQLQAILLGGEQAGPNIVRTWTPRAQLYAWYGLAECFNLSMVEQLVNGKDPSLHAPPADTSTVYIVNEDGDGRLILVEPHQEGELCIAGPQLATGYLYNEAETSRVFSPNPFADGGPKLLRTGDRAVWETGEDSLLAIRIVGRTDWQIKIAGQRVAPEEVTAVLREDELFQDAVALGAKVREESVLVGAIVMKSGATAGFWQELPILRQRLAQRLPAYMVPTHWLPVEAIPMNAAGKIDLCQLRTIVEVSDPSALLGRVRVGTEGPGEEWSGTEAAIRDIWAEVLGLPAASIRHEDSFQALGGTSLLALRVLVLMRRTGLGLELRELLDAETLDSLAARVAVTVKQDASEAAEIAPFSLLKDPEARERFSNWSGAVDAYPLMPMQLYFALTAMHGMEPYLLHRLWRLPISTVREVDRLREAFAVVFAHPQHAVLRTVFVPDAQYGLVQVVRGDIDLPWSTSSAEGDDEQALMAYERAHVTELFLNPDRLAWAVKLLPQGRLLVSAHHALFDWWSWPFLYHEVARVFHGMAVLPRAPYKAYVAHYMSQDHAQMMPKIRANREKTSAIRSKIMDAYQDHLLPSPTCSHILQLPASLMPHLVQRRINFSAAVLAAWLAVMARRILGQDVVRTGATTSFRDVPVAGVDVMNGCAMGTCGLCIDVQPNESIGGLVSRVYDHLWEAIDMAHLSVATLISERAPVAVDTIVNILLTSNDNQAMDLELCELADVIKLHGKQQPKNEEKEGGAEGEREVENDSSEIMADGVRARQLFGRGSRYGMMNMNFCTVQVLPSSQQGNLVLYLQAPLQKGLLDEWVKLTFGILVAIADDPDALVEDLVPPKA